MELKTIVEAIIIIIVITFLIILPTKGWAGIKYILNWDIEEQNIQLSQDMMDKSKEIFSSYDNCFNSKKNNCLCDINLQLFPEGYLLMYENVRLDFSKIKESFMDGFGFTRPGSTIGSSYQFFTGKNINCYVEYDSSTGLINTKSIGKTSYLLLYALTGIVTTEGAQTTSHSFLNNKPTFYKFKNEICFVLEDKLVKKGQDYINNLPKC